VPYPKNLLNDGEEIVLDLKPHWMYVAPTIIVAGGGTIAWIVLWVMTGGGWLGWATLIVALLLGVNASQRWAKWSTTSFTITTDRVIFRQGLVSKNGVEIPLERVMNVNFNQSIWERMIGAGDLLIESGGRDGQSRFSDVRKPELVAKELHNQTNRYTREPRLVIPQSGSDLPPPPPAAPPVSDHADQLAKLHDLLTRGAITQAEYDTKKAELLNKL
jgi:membrane protein YdbS with pleckstrin-like domain